MELRLGTRKSTLAMVQANQVRNLIQSKYPDLTVTVIPMSTTGDRFLSQPLTTIGGKGVFVKEIERALLNNEIDIAVHSMKDVPTRLAPGLTIAAILKRETPDDALVTRTPRLGLQSLSGEGTIGTSSLRRRSQLIRHNPKLKIRDLRGNINTRLNKLARGDFDGIILAAAGLDRIGFTGYHRIPHSILLPSPAQGAIGIETRADDPLWPHLIAPLADTVTTITVNAERQTLAIVEGDCRVPIAILATLFGESFSISARLLNRSGTKMVHVTRDGHPKDAQPLAIELGNMLREGQGAKILKEIFSDEDT